MPTSALRRLCRPRGYADLRLDRLRRKGILAIRVGIIRLLGPAAPARLRRKQKAVSRRGRASADHESRGTRFQPSTVRSRRPRIMPTTSRPSTQPTTNLPPRSA
jgi:hypothetical protein